MWLSAGIILRFIYFIRISKMVAHCGAVIYFSEVRAYTVFLIWYIHWIGAVFSKTWSWHIKIFRKETTWTFHACAISRDSTIKFWQYLVWHKMKIEPAYSIPIYYDFLTSTEVQGICIVLIGSTFIYTNQNTALI